MGGEGAGQSGGACRAAAGWEGGYAGAGKARRGGAGRKVGRKDGEQSGAGMADSRVDCRDPRGHTSVVSPTRVPVPDKLFATASVATATVWTAAAAAVKHEHATKNYRRAFNELISRIARCSKEFLRIFHLLSLLE